MEGSNEPESRIGFFSFVGSTYSPSSTLLNFNSPGIEKEYIHVPAKFFKSAKWIFKNRGSSAELDVLVVMSPCHVLTPMLKMASKKPVILDAGGSLTDGVLFRGFEVRNFYKLPLIAAMDLISMHSASVVRVESMLQRNRVRNFFCPPTLKVTS